MKVISFLIVQWFAIVSINIISIWIIVEFILYLVKDKVFNWWSIWFLIISTVVALVFSVLASIIKIREKKETVTTDRKKSMFQQKIEEIERKRNNK